LSLFVNDNLNLTVFEVKHGYYGSQRLTLDTIDVSNNKLDTLHINFE